MVTVCSQKQTSSLVETAGTFYMLQACIQIRIHKTSKIRLYVDDFENFYQEACSHDKCRHCVINEKYIEKKRMYV